MRGTGKNGFYLPGGKLEPGESDREALAREIREELGCRIDFATLRYYTTTVAQAFAKPEGVIVRVTTFVGRLIGVPRPMSEVAELRFFRHGEYKAMSSRAPAAEILLDKLSKEGLVLE